MSDKLITFWAICTNCSIESIIVGVFMGIAVGLIIGSILSWVLEKKECPK